MMKKMHKSSNNDILKVIYVHPPVGILNKSLINAKALEA